MLKKILLGVVVLSLVGASVVYLSSCAVKQGPLSPNTSLVSSTDGRSAEMPAVSSITTGLLSLTGEIRVVFDKKMNNTTLNTNTVLIYHKDGSNTSELPYDFFSITYLDATKTLILRPTDVAGWTNDTQYRIQLMHGVMSAAGAPLDGNNNDINDGNVLDDYHSQFFTGAPAEIGYGFFGLELSGVPVDALGGTVGDLRFSNVGNVPTAYTYITITARFSNNLDAATIFVDASTLHQNFSIVNVDTGATPTIVSISQPNPDEIQVVLILDPASRYKFTLLGGLSGIRSSSAATEVLNRGKYFAYGGTNNCFAEANDKLEAYLSTAAADNTAITYPDISGYSWQPGDRRFRLTFNTPMDKTTLTNANILLIGRYPQTGEGQVYNIVPKYIDITWSGNVVYIYLPDRFYPADYSSAPLVNAKVIVKRHVKSEAGQYLDVDPNPGPPLPDADGVVLTDEDDYVPSWANDVSSGI